MISTVIHYAEISLKGNNKYTFVNALVKNIKRSCARSGVILLRIRKEFNRIMCDFENCDRQIIISTLSSVFGMKYFAFIEETETELPKILGLAKNVISDFATAGIKTMSFKTKRAYKQFALTSPGLNAQFGGIAQSNGIKVDYDCKESVLYCEVGPKKTLIYSKKHMCRGGLPVGVSGRVLVLLSGGIDSPVAAWLMMKRGCTCDFIHVHSFPENSQVKGSKIWALASHLNKFQYKSTLYSVPYSVYEAGTLGKVGDREELVLFKHYLLKLADAAAKKLNYEAIVTGDALGQVASQTLPNINAAQTDILSTVLRPLITFDKDEIVDLARKIGTYETSLGEYKDCCSLVARHPHTKTTKRVFDSSVSNVDFGRLIDDSIAAMSREAVSDEKLYK